MKIFCGFLLFIGLPTGPLSSQDMASRIDAYLRHRAGPPFSGVVIVATANSVLFERAYGMADADLRVPITPEMRFRIGSLTKPFTATAVMRSVELGKLHLDDRICSFLKQCPPSWREVTLRQLLGHTSGIPDLFNELPAAPVESTTAVIDAAISRHTADSLKTKPGEAYAYNNFGYFLLGYALEATYHAPWEQIVRTLVLAPAGMNDTRYDDVWAIIPNRVRGYTVRDGKLRNITYKDHSAYAAGGLLSTADDILRFDRALSRGQLVADSTLRQMTNAGLGSYGLGLQVIRAFGQQMRNHTGGVDGFASHLAHYADGTTIIVLSNVEDEPAKATACDIAAIRFGLAPTPGGKDRVACRPER